MCHQMRQRSIIGVDLNAALCSYDYPAYQFSVSSCGTHTDADAGLLLSSSGYL